MTTNPQDIILYPPGYRSRIALLLAVVLLFLGIDLTLWPLFGGHWQGIFLGVLFLTGETFLFTHYWTLLQTPVLVINRKGITLRQRTLTMVTWEEISTLYITQIKKRDALGIDVSASGIRSFRQRHGYPYAQDIPPAQAQPALLVTEKQLAFPVPQLLALIRERFADQLQQYHIEVRDERQHT